MLLSLPTLCTDRSSLSNEPVEIYLFILLALVFTELGTPLCAQNVGLLYLCSYEAQKSCIDNKDHVKPRWRKHNAFELKGKSFTDCL